MLFLGRLGQSSLNLGGRGEGYGGRGGEVADIVIIDTFVEYPHLIGFWCSTIVNLACGLALYFCYCLSVLVLMVVWLSVGTTARYRNKGGGEDGLV